MSDAEGVGYLLVVSAVKSAQPCQTKASARKAKGEASHEGCRIEREGPPERDVEIGDKAIMWSVTSASEQEAAQIRALGFFGLMATGAHHLAIARGDFVH